MSGLMPYAGGGGLSRSDRRALRRELQVLDRRTTLRLAQNTLEADIQADRVQDVQYVGQQALHAATMVSALEASLAQVVPHAAPRLHAIADCTALALAQIVTDTARRTY